MKKVFQIKHTRYSLLLNHEVNMFSKDAKNTYGLKFEGYWREQDEGHAISFIFNFTSANEINMHKAEKILLDLNKIIVSKINENIELKQLIGNTPFSIENVVINISIGSKMFSCIQGFVTYHANEDLTKILPSQIAILDKTLS